MVPNFHNPYITPVTGVGFGVPSTEACEEKTEMKDHSLGYLVMPRAEGGDLFDAIINSVFRWEEKVEVLLEILCGLAELHSHGIVYGDMKPENILLTDKKRPQIADFGLMWPVKAKMASCDQGSLAYLAPEQLFGHATCSREMDIWSTGLTAPILFFGDNLVYRQDDPRVERVTKSLRKWWTSQEEKLNLTSSEHVFPSLVSLLMYWTSLPTVWIQKYVETKRQPMVQALVQWIDAPDKKGRNLRSQTEKIFRRKQPLCLK